MAMAQAQYRFERRMSEAMVRDALRLEVGHRAGERYIDIVVSSDGAVVTLESMDGIAVVYGEKVCAALGGVAVRPRNRPLPEWTATPWIRLGWWRRFRLWLGPTKL